jgi:hypothetical protein
MAIVFPPSLDPSASPLLLLSYLLLSMSSLFTFEVVLPMLNTNFARLLTDATVLASCVFSFYEWVDVTDAINGKL